MGSIVYVAVADDSRLLIKYSLAGRPAFRAAAASN
jgi:hypothetical protein